MFSTKLLSEILHALTVFWRCVQELRGMWNNSLLLVGVFGHASFRGNKYKYIRKYKTIYILYELDFTNCVGWTGTCKYRYWSNSKLRVLKTLVILQLQGKKEKKQLNRVFKMETSQYANNRLSNHIWIQAGCQDASRRIMKHPHISFVRITQNLIKWAASKTFTFLYNDLTLSEQLIISSITLKGSAGENYKPSAPFSGFFLLKPWLNVSLWTPRPSPRLGVILTTITDCNVTVRQHNTWYGLRAGFSNRCPGDRT